MSNKQLRQALEGIRANANAELEDPSGLHMTCLSIIKKAAEAALSLPDDSADVEAATRAIHCWRHQQQ